MTITEIKKLTEDEAKKRLNGLVDSDDYLDSSKTCGLPNLSHEGNTCRRSNRAELKKECQVWEEYRAMIKPIVV